LSMMIFLRYSVRFARQLRTAEHQSLPQDDLHRPQLLESDLLQQYRKQKRINGLAQMQATAWEALWIGESFESVYAMNDAFRIYADHIDVSPEAAATINAYREGYMLYALLIWRTCGFCYFFGVAMLWGYVHFNGHDAHFFTVWNIDLIALYFLLAMISTWIGVFYDKDFRAFQQHRSQIHGHESVDDRLAGLEVSFWSPTVLTLGYCVQIMHCVVGATALFVTVIAFTSLDHDMELWNISFHLCQSITFLVDCVFNGINVRWELILFNIAWMSMYVAFIWVMVATKVVTDWPYFFLDATTTAVFVWYPLVFAANLIFFHLWLGIHHVKYVIAQSKWRSQMQRFHLRYDTEFDKTDFSSPLVSHLRDDIVQQ
jgi:hypothetical protein